MKKHYYMLCVLLLLPSVYAYSLDVILTKARMQIQCNIISEDDNTVVYQLVDSQDKELYAMDRADIEKVYQHVDDIAAKDQNKIEAQEVVKKINDAIVLNDGTALEVVLVEVTDSHVKYRKANNIEGPLFVKEIANISMIIYSNGEKEYFTHSTPKAEKTTVKTENKVIAQENTVPTTKVSTTSATNANTALTTTEARKSGRIYRDKRQFIYNDTYISTKEVERIFQRENAVAYQKWKKGNGLVIGGAVCVGIAGGLVVGGLFPIIFEEYGAGIGLECAALVPLGVGLGLALCASRNYNQAIDIYNSKFDQAAVQLKWRVSANGVGLAIAF